jgi:hypothetical protein
VELPREGQITSSAAAAALRSSTGGPEIETVHDVQLGDVVGLLSGHQDGVGTRPGAPGVSGSVERAGSRIVVGDGPVSRVEGAAGNSTLGDGARSVSPDGLAGGSVSAPQQPPGSVTLMMGGVLVASAEDDAIMARFVRDYVGLLDERVALIKAEVESRNDLTAHVALLSLESSSAMVGERELASLVRLLRSAVERGHRSVIPGLLTSVGIEAGRVHERLTPPGAGGLHTAVGP